MRVQTILLTIVAALISQLLIGQKPYFQQQVDVKIAVRLDDSLHRLTAQATIDYTNHSPDTLRFIWFHLWPNAYKTERTALGQQLLENGDTKFYFSKADQRGYINQLDFRVNGQTAKTQDHPQHLDITKLLLPNPLPPGNSIRISTPFTVQLPAIFSRSGHSKNNTYQVTQWYPKPAVYDRTGWHPMPYLDQGEFYSEFGNYHVSITLPEKYVVAATGQLTDTTERARLLSRTGSNEDAGSNNRYKTLHYRADSVHDFAWFASPTYQIQFDTCSLPDGSVKEIWHFNQPGSEKVWKKSIDYSKQALRYYSERIGSYPYPTISVVESADGTGGGMEYPMLSVIDPIGNTEELRTIIQHEIGHNWFYAVLATNERIYPWMDEGLNSYYERKLATNLPDRTEELLLEYLYHERQDQPIQTPAEKFTPINYGAIAYLKAANWVEHMERRLGQAVFDKAMQDYYQSWKFKHPMPEDLLKHLQDKSRGDLSFDFELLNKTGPLVPAPKRGWVIQGINRWFEQKNRKIKNQITAFPAIGYNQADGVMAGLGLTNIKLPLNDMQWLVIPLYATKTKEFNGIGFLNHRWRPEGIWKRIDLGMSVARFSFNRFTAPNGQELIQRFTKLTPGVRFTWREDPRSARHRYLQLSYVRIGETSYRLQRDTTVNTSGDTVINNNYRSLTNKRGLFRIQYVQENNRKLYPYRWEAQVQFNGSFARPSITWNQFFNYPKGGGLHMRVFAGGFLYLGAQSTAEKFRLSRYYLQLSGPTGEQDYTYSNYFLGRSAFKSLASQQIMERDGAFKMRTDRLSNPIGRSDSWLIALNLSSSIPDSWNPLRVLPIRIPLYVFADIGASGSTWKLEEQGPRWLYTAGLEIPLLRRSIRIYVPLIYSNPFRDYVQSILGPKGRLGKRISFEINLDNLTPRRIQNEIDLW